MLLLSRCQYWRAAVTQFFRRFSQTTDEVEFTSSVERHIVSPTLCATCIFTHRRSIAEWGGCFQRSLLVFVSLFVCFTITSRRLNVGRWNLAVRCNVQKSRLSWNVKVKGQGHRAQKNEKSAAFSGSVFAGAATPVGKSARAVWCRLWLRLHLSRCC